MDAKLLNTCRTKHPNGASQHIAISMTARTYADYTCHMKICSNYLTWYCKPLVQSAVKEGEHVAVIKIDWCAAEGTPVLYIKALL